MLICEEQSFVYTHNQRDAPMIKKIGKIVYFIIIFACNPLSAHNIVCFPTGQAIPPAELAQLNCRYHTAVIVNADINRLETDTKEAQKGVYQCLIYFDVGDFPTSTIRLIDLQRSHLSDASRLIPAHTYTSSDGHIIDAYVYFEYPPTVIDLNTGAPNSLVNVIKETGMTTQFGFTTTQLGTALGTHPRVYSRYRPEVLRNLAVPISRVFTSTGYFQGCKVIY
jgi:hypothetical protein